MSHLEVTREEAEVLIPQKDVYQGEKTPDSGAFSLTIYIQ